LYRPIELGKINVEDPDDWDVGDKKFSWLNESSTTMEDLNVRNNFYIDSNSGQILAKKLINGLYKLKFQIFDNHYQHMNSYGYGIGIIDEKFKAIKKD
ncbi:hypothetical protein BLA29_006252, partial [Euroglyphus maynei]